MVNPETKKIDTAFVLGGGGNRGAVQAGALLALLENGIVPQLLVGTSVGSLNALQIAANPAVSGAEKLIDIWHGAQNNIFRRARFITIGRRLLAKSSSLSGNERLKAYVAENMPSAITKFADFTRAQLRVVATDLNTGQIHVFGDDLSETVLDGVMASIALPIYLPPWEYQGRQYVDGGVVSALPVLTALRYKPRIIYVLDISTVEGERQHRIKGMIDIVSRVIDVMLQHQIRNEMENIPLEEVEAIYHIDLNAFRKTPLWDMSRVDNMINSGREIATDFLSNSRQTGYV